MFKFVLLLALPLTLCKTTGKSNLVQQVGKGNNGDNSNISGKINQGVDDTFSEYDYDTDTAYGNIVVAEVAGLGGTSVSQKKDAGSSSSSAKSQLTTMKKSTIQSEIYCDRAYSCSSCSSGRVCVPTRDGQKFYEISRYPCTEQSPYCNYKTGSCSNTPDPGCYDLPATVPTKAFLCMRDGYYPDPFSCERFYSCKNKVAYEHFCPYFPTPYYHPGLRLCVASKDFCTDSTSSPKCKNRNNHGRKIPIMYTDKYFISCGVNKNILSVDMCIGYHHFDPDTQMCVFECPHQGLFLNALDCTKYIKCSHLPQDGFLKTDMSCPEGQAFLESEFSCVDRELVRNCKEPYSDLFNK